MAFALKDTDLLVLNRADASYKVSGKNFKTSFDRMYLSRYGDSMEGDLTIESSYGLRLKQHEGKENFVAVYSKFGQVLAKSIDDVVGDDLTAIDGGSY